MATIETLMDDLWWRLQDWATACPSEVDSDPMLETAYKRILQILRNAGVQPEVMDRLARKYDLSRLYRRPAVS